MTARAVWSIWCDHAGDCGAWVAQADDRVQALEAAYQSGWVRGRRSGLHFCPAHNPESLLQVLRDGGFEVSTDDPVTTDQDHPLFPAQDALDPVR